MVTSSFGKRNFMQPMRRLSLHSWMVQFFPFWRGLAGGDMGFLFFPLFPSGSQSVLKCIPKDVPNSTWVLFHAVCPKFNSLVCKLKRWNPKVHICFYFATQGPKSCFYWGHAQSSKRIADGPINMALLKKRKSCEGTHDLINMNHTIVGYKLRRRSVLFFLMKFHQISSWKIWFQPMQRIFLGKNDPNSSDFKKTNSNCQILCLAKNIEGFWFFLHFHIYL